MVHFSIHTSHKRVTCQANMQNGFIKTGRVVAVDGPLVSTPKRQQKAKSTSSRQERGSCSSTASCPVFSGRQSAEDLPPRCPSSLSSPTLHGSVSSLQGSIPTVKGLASSLKSFQSSNTSLHSCSPSTSSSQRSSSEDDSWDTNSWSSGATCLLRSSIRQHSEEVFRARAGSGSRPEGTSDSETTYQNSDSHKGSAVESESRERAAVSRRDSERSLTSSQSTSAASTASTELEEKIEAKLKFSKFLDEVTCRVLDPECLQAFGAIRQRGSPDACPQTSFFPPHSCVDSPRFRDPWANCMPTCKILDSSDTLRRTQEELPSMETSCRAYLETDIDQVRREHEINSSPTREMEKRTSQSRVESSHSKRSPVLNHSDGAPRPPQRSTSLSRAVNNPTADVEDVCDNSSVQEQNDDLRRRLNYTSYQLHMLEKEFDSSRQYLETELQHTQDELGKFTEKLHRIQSSYTTLQRINQKLQDKMRRMTKLHEEETRSLSREILILKNHLIDANITIHKLQEDNDLYKRDCKLAARLLHCGKSPHKPSELSAGFQDGASSHLEKHVGRMSDSVPSAIINKVQENPEAVSCPHTDKLQQRKSCDLYRSDTALYCRGERWPERRQSVDLHNTEEDTFNRNLAPFSGFTLGSLPVSSSYSSFSAASEAKSLMSSQQLWREGQNSFSYEKDASGFPKSNSFQHVAHGFPASYRGPCHLPEDDLSERWRQMSVEDVKTFSLHSSGPGSSFSCSPTSTNIKPSYSSSSIIPDMNPCLSVTAPDVIHTDTGLNFGFHSRFRNSKNQQQTQDRNVKNDYVSESPNSSAETLNQSLEASNVQQYKKNLQKKTREYVNMGLSRKDSLTKAQLYGTLLN